MNLITLKIKKMKRFYLLFAGLLFVSIFSQNITVPPTGITITENYTYSRSYLEPVTTSSTTAKQVEAVQYFDGLGRPKQSVAIKASPKGNDLVTTIPYDGFGRQVDSYLPVSMATTNGGIQSLDTSGVISYYTTAQNTTTKDFDLIDTNPFSHKVLENSPLDRVQQQIQVGSAWANKPVAFTYDTNGDNEVIKFVTTTTWVNNTTISTVAYAQPSQGNGVNESYSANVLYKNTITDEDGNISIEFKNGKGQTILVRKKNGTQNIDTYYVYNEYGQLAFVISPLTLSATNFLNAIDELCYQYRYDNKNRLVEKKLPGKGWEFMVYDQQDRLIATQDALLASTNNNFGAKGWLFTKYDQFGRVAYTGFKADASSRSTLQTTINSNTTDPQNNEGRSTTTFANSGLAVYYTNTAFPVITTADKLLSVNYYDTYPAVGTPFPTGNKIQNVPTLQEVATTGVIQTTKSFPTASFVKNIENNNWTKNYTFYDQNGRPIGSHSINHLGGYTKTESILDFSGVPQQTFTYHKRKNTDAELQIKERFVYNLYNNALEKHYHEVVGKTPEELLTENTYNEIGQLTKKKVGNNIQEIDFSYNIRGWMTGINLDDEGNFKPSKLFNYKINYNEILSNFITTPYTADQSLEVKEKFNGNISAVTWKSSADPVATEKKYGYVYDKLNRLSAGFYYEKFGTSFLFTEEYNELLDYDHNGNIKHLKRFSFKESTAANMIDNLTYTYENNNQSNRLQKIDDPANNASGYEGGGVPNSYDLNGNMTQMPDKGITTPIAYNFLNLPSMIKQGRNTTNYLYRADGTKLKKTFNFVNKMGSSFVYTEYLDGFQYSTPNTDPLRMALEEQDDETVSVAKAANIETFSSLETREKVVAPPNPVDPPMVLSFFPNAEGFYDYENLRYIYQYKDHLGNVRVSYVKDGSSLKVMDTNDYYPFGMSLIKSDEIAVYDPLSVPYNYKYNGKELQETGMYDYGARMYMPDIGRWGVVDPLAETSRKWSTYTYVYDNPIMFIDPTGMEGELAKCPTCPNTDEFKPYIDDPKNTYVYDPKTKTAEKEIQIEEVVIHGTKPLNIGTRALGGLQMAGGTLEAIVGGVGGILTAETGVGAAAGWFVLMNGVDNATTGAQQLWTGEDEETLLHEGVEEGSLALGADEEAAENIATGADVATMFVGGGSSLKSAKNLKPMYTNTKGLKQIGLRATNTNKQLRLERHALQGTGRKLTRTHINYGLGGKKHKFFRNAKELRKYVKE